MIGKILCLLGFHFKPEIAMVTGIRLDPMRCLYWWVCRRPECRRAVVTANFAQGKLYVVLPAVQPERNPTEGIRLPSAVPGRR
jgi:hypothetical protein